MLSDVPRGCRLEGVFIPTHLGLVNSTLLHLAAILFRSQYLENSEHKIMTRQLLVRC